MRLILFCEQTGARLDPKQSATDCAAKNCCTSYMNCPLMAKPLEPNQQVSASPPVDISS